MYEQIAHNKRASWLLMAAVVAAFLVMGFVIGVAVTGRPYGGLGLLGVFGVIAILWSIIGYYAGAGMVLAVSGARQVTHAEAPQLWNVVEEMTIAAGVPMPAVYVIDDAAPNAFATGRDPQHASVAATTGLLQMMNREELQGVIAHEMSHVRNYDVRFATLVGILVGLIALMADFFLLAVALAVLAPLFGWLVQMAISRRREYLADASAAELTRNPVGLAHALEKIAADPRPLRTANRATAHLFIANPLRKWRESENLFDTHPPIQKRIAVLLAMAHEGPAPEAPAPQTA
ncbi:MAG TPA: M48 family metallopeptidase [Thermoleophilia bacterium]|nr:M48 family metallopeptidase [Thermoleophilia bacterium]